MASPFFSSLVLLAAVYLAVLASHPRVATPSVGAAYRVGLMTGLTNPKSAVFWTSAFATLLPAVSPPWFQVLVVLMVLLLSLGWHRGITRVSGLPALRQRYLRLELTINGVARGALVLLGVPRMAGR